MFETDAQLEQFLENVNMDDTPNPSHRDALEQQLLEAYAQRQSSEQKSVWRTIMKSKITKSAAAAVIMLAVFMGIRQFRGSVGLATIAFAEISEVMKKVPWMHQVSMGFERGTTGTGEQWISFEQEIHASKWANGKVNFMNLKEHKSYSYDPKDQTITINYIQEDSFPLNLSSPVLMLESMYKTLKEQGAQIITKEAQFQGQKVLLQDITMTLSGQNKTESQSVRLYLNPKSKLLLGAQIKGTNAAGEVIMDGEATFSYPDTGPLSIYDLGVPASAKIVNNTPPRNVNELLDKYEHYRKMEPLKYISIAIGNGSTEIMFKDGVLSRTETRSAKNSYEWGKQSKDLTSNFESLLNWWMNNDNSKLDSAIYLYDGKIDYFCSLSSGKIYPVEGHNPNHRTLHDYGWPDIRMWIGAGRDLNIIETEYSKEKGLICLELLIPGEILHNDNDYVSLPRRNLYYIVPAKDYVCVRSEFYSIRNASWQKDKAWLKDMDSNKILPNSYNFSEILEFAQTDDGQWYPKKIKNTWCESMGSKERISYQDIYLDTNPIFPKDIFNPNNLPKVK